MEQIIYFLGTYLIYISVLYAVIYLFVKHRKNFIKSTVLVLGSAVVSWVIAHFLKGIIAHPRPEVFLTPIIKPDDIYSFPSGHASFMFALGFAMNYFSFRAGIVIVILAMVTGIARVLAGIHFSYDIIGGAVLGYLVSVIAFYFYDKLFKKD